jgi:hypothetical protein
MPGRRDPLCSAGLECAEIPLLRTELRRARQGGRARAAGASLAVRPLRTVAGRPQ